MPTRITSHRGKLDLFVTVDGQELPIYDLQYVRGEPSAWIACETGKTYHVHLACKGYPSSKEFRKMTSSLNAELRLDGVLVEEISSVGPNHPQWDWRGQEDMKDIVWKGTYTRPGYKKPFIFQAPVSSRRQNSTSPSSTHLDLGHTLATEIPRKDLQAHRPGKIPRPGFHPGSSSSNSSHPIETVGQPVE
jgi:hypothetical protein